jgi:hypothetical protein
MRTSSVVAASVALVAGANAWGNVTYTTEVVTAYTTFCPSAAEIIHGTKTYTVTEVSISTPIARTIACAEFGDTISMGPTVANPPFLRQPPW